MRAVPVNVNYRYLDEELRYLLDNADAEVLVFHASLGDRVNRVRQRLPRLRLLLEVDDDGESIGVDRYEEAVARHEPTPRIRRDAADITMTYTGGTTGMPKGVMSPIGATVSGLLATTPAIVGLAPLEDPADVASLAVRLAAEGRTMSSGTEIVDTLRAELSSYKLPRELVLVDHVPRAPNGKADYPAARRQFSGSASCT